MTRNQVCILFAAIAATITSVGGLMLYLGNRDTIAGATMDAFVKHSEESRGMISPRRNSKALTVYYRSAGKHEQSILMLARDEAEATAIVLDL